MLENEPPRLTDLNLLAVDCQATSATPGKGFLFDIAWAPTREPVPQIEGTRVRLPPGETIPRRVSQLTGVATKDLKNSPSPDEVARRLGERISGWHDVVFLAHWARYEQAWIEHLLGQPVDWICTHNVAQRLLPGLPRKGLRAVAGYLGRPLSQTKGAREHVDATLFVWRELVGLLAEEGVHTLDELWRWLEQPVKKTDERLYPLPRETRLALPKQPGVYRMLNRNGGVLYVGKATSLKDRVNSYFRQRRLAPDKMELVSQVWDLDVTVTESALEAALLETDEIKRLAPPYNHALRAEGRGVTWCSRHSFRDLSAVPTANHELGPFSSGTMCAHFAEVIDFVNGEGSLSWFGTAAPEVLDAARASFCARHGVARLDVEEVLRLGQALHPLDGVEDHEADGPSVTAVTEEAVVQMLEWAVVSAHRAVARGEWLRRLARGRVRWAPHGAPDTRRELALGVDSFETVDDYDRVSVTLAELRRILRDGRDVSIVDADGEELDAELLSMEFERF